MFKKVLLSAMVATVFSSVNAYAISNPAWERPIKHASMDILDAGGIFEDLQDVAITLTQRDGEDQPTGIILEMISEGSEEVRPLFFPIKEIKADRCGSVTYYASRGSVYASQNITLVDHRLRRCMDRVAGEWVANVTFTTMCQPPTDYMNLRGVPESVFSIMSTRP